MTLSELLNRMKNKWKFIVLVTFMVAAASFSVSALLTPRYESIMSLIVIQKQPEDKVDAFSAAKSAEYLSDIFAKVVYTDSFINDVLKSPLNIQRTFSDNREDRKKEWEREVAVKTVNNTGIIKLSVLDPSRKEAEKIAQAIAWNLSTNGQKYHGGGDKIIINVIDGPETSNRPASPNLIINTALGLFMGFSLAVAYIYFFKKGLVAQEQKLKYNINFVSDNSNANFAQN